jgi:hypothetical protein
MNRLTRAALGAALTLVASCYTSPPPRSYPPALRPNGVTGELTTADHHSVQGELLEVRDSSYVLLVSGRVTVVPYAAVVTAHFSDQDWMSFGYSSPSANRREQLRWDSRFPFGIRADALDALLGAAGQTKPDTVGLGSR